MTCTLAEARAVIAAERQRMKQHRLGLLQKAFKKATGKKLVVGAQFQINPWRYVEMCWPNINRRNPKKMRTYTVDQILPNPGHIFCIEVKNGRQDVTMLLSAKNMGNEKLWKI